MATLVKIRGIERPANSNALTSNTMRVRAALGSVYPSGTKASLTTSMTGTNNDVTLTAISGGTWGNNLGLKLTDPAGANKTLSVSYIYGETLVFDVSLSTDGSGAITTTANQLVAALNSNPLFVQVATAAVKTGDTGSGVVTALTTTLFSGGTNTGTGEPLYLKVTYKHPVVVDLEDRKVQRDLRRNRYRYVDLGAV